LNGSERSAAFFKPAEQDRAEEDLEEAVFDRAQGDELSFEQMRLAIAVVSFLTAYFTSLSLSAGDCAHSAQPIPICTVLADVAKYDGKERGNVLGRTACATKSRKPNFSALRK
jgi:hypothetical protein